MPLFSAYVDVNDVLTNGTMNVETASLVGLNTTLSNGVAAGVNALPVVATAGGPAAPATFQAWILDGPNSEVVVASVTDGTHLAVPAGTLAAHAAGVSISSAGIAGCLASIITTVSSSVETICKQGPDGGDRSLWQQSRTEKLPGPNSYRAAFDVDRSLLLRPYHFPIASLASVTVQLGAQGATSVDTSFAYVQADGRTAVVPWAQVLGAPPALYWLGNPFPRNMAFLVSVTYTGGPCAGTTLSSVPQSIREAMFLLVMDRLGFRTNPIGAASLRRGDTQYEMRLRGDTSGKSILRIQAEDWLEPYMQRF